MIQILIALLIVALLCWLAANYTPKPFNFIICVVIILLATVWTLQRLGMLGNVAL